MKLTNIVLFFFKLRVIQNYQAASLEGPCLHFWQLFWQQQPPLASLQVNLGPCLVGLCQGQGFTWDSQACLTHTTIYLNQVWVDFNTVTIRKLGISFIPQFECQEPMCMALIGVG